MAAMIAVMEGRDGPRIPFAPPFLRAGDLLISQAAECAAHVGEREGLAPSDPADRAFARSIVQTTADFVAEIHDTHHPVDVGLAYEDQRDVAKRRAAAFRTERLPRFLGWYEALIAANPSRSGFLTGAAMTYADLGLFQTIAGLAHAFPRRLETLVPRYPTVSALHETVARTDRVAAYLASERRIPFDQTGIFRHYPELDAA